MAARWLPAHGRQPAVEVEVREHPVADARVDQLHRAPERHEGADEPPHPHHDRLLAARRRHARQPRGDAVERCLHEVAELHRARAEGCKCGARLARLFHHVQGPGPLARGRRVGCGLVLHERAPKLRVRVLGEQRELGEDGALRLREGAR